MKNTEIHFSAGKENYTNDVVNVLGNCADGSCIIFEKGTYHFYDDGAFESFFAPSNNESGVKKVAFPLIGLSNITIDGNGSTFIFHESISPFVISGCKNIKIKNITLTTHFAPYALMKITSKNKCGFTAHFKNSKIPYDAISGNLVFKSEKKVINTGETQLSMHSTERLLIRYLFSENCQASRQGLPAPYVDCSVEKNGEEFVFSYSNDPMSSECEYEVGETVCINLEESRARDVFFLENSFDTKFSDITIRRGCGMGFIAQLCHNIEIERLIAKPFPDEPVSTTADIIHLVNCSGKFSVHHSVFDSSLDDACNVHGNYSVITETGNRYICVEYGHPQHSFLDMYKNGDELTVIDSENLDVIGTLLVEKAEFTDQTGLRQRIYCQETVPDTFKTGFLVESAKRMPDVHIHDNLSVNIPNWRLSGAGDILVENNTYKDCFCPVYSYDLAKFWLESGRIKNLTIRNNSFSAEKDNIGFISTGVSGYSGKDTPDIHGTITVENNLFDTECSTPYTICGFKNAVIRNNINKIK